MKILKHAVNFSETWKVFQIKDFEADSGNFHLCTILVTSLTIVIEIKPAESSVKSIIVLTHDSGTFGGSFINQEVTSGLIIKSCFGISLDELVPYFVGTTFGAICILLTKVISKYPLPSFIADRVVHFSDWKTFMTSQEDDCLRMFQSSEGEDPSFIGYKLGGQMEVIMQKIPKVF